MKRRRKATPTGSLDLLLDTICNAFGSIILIALLIVLLTADVPTIVAGAVSSPERDQIERAIANAEETVKSLQDEIDVLNVGSDALKFAELRSNIEDAKARLKAAQDARGGADADIPVDYSATVRDLRTAERNSNVEIAAITNLIETLNKREESLKQQLSRIQSETQEMVEARTVRFRLPRETSTSRSPVNVIFLHDEIFWFAINGRDNSQAISFTQVDGGGIKLVPIRGRGDTLPAAAARTKALVGEVDRGSFIACYVFPDSVEVFRKFREIAYSSGAEIGWSLEGDPERLIFGKDGTSPKPQ